MEVNELVLYSPIFPNVWGQSVMGVSAIVWAFQTQQSSRISTPTQADTEVRKTFSLRASAELFQPHSCSTEPPQQSAPTAWDTARGLCSPSLLVWETTTTADKEVRVGYNSVVRILKHLTLFLRERMLNNAGKWWQILPTCISVWKFEKGFCLSE